MVLLEGRDCNLLRTILNDSKEDWCDKDLSVMLVLLSFVDRSECVHELQLHSQVADGAHWELNIDAVQVNRWLVGFLLGVSLIGCVISH